MLDMIKAMQDPEFVKGLSDMPRQIAETLQRIEAKLDLLIWEVAGWDGNDIAAMLQNSDAANLQNSDDVNTTVTLDTTAAGRHPREQEAYDAGRLAGYEDAMVELAAKQDLLLQRFSIAANLQNSDDVNTAVTLDSTAEPVNINPVDPASYLDME